MFGVKECMFGVKECVFGVKECVFGIKECVFGVKEAQERRESPGLSESQPSVVPHPPGKHLSVTRESQVVLAVWVVGQLLQLHSRRERNRLGTHRQVTMTIIIQACNIAYWVYMYTCILSVFMCFMYADMT